MSTHTGIPPRVELSLRVGDLQVGDLIHSEFDGEEDLVCDITYLDGGRIVELDVLDAHSECGHGHGGRVHYASLVVRIRRTAAKLLPEAHEF